MSFSPPKLDLVLPINASVHSQLVTTIASQEDTVMELSSQSSSLSVIGSSQNSFVGRQQLNSQKK